MPALSRDFLNRYGTWAVVTGASSGLGAEYAKQLAFAGLSVVLVARREDRLQQIAAKLERDFHVRSKVIKADLAEEDGWKTVITLTEQLDIGLLVNNAGLNLVGSFLRDPLERHQQLINVHVTAATALAHAFGRRFVERGRGGILFTSSVLARPYPWYSTYSATKSYLSTLSVILKEEFEAYGITVLVVEPGWVETEMVEREKQLLDYDKLDASIQSAEECVQEALQALDSRKSKVVTGFTTRVSEFFFGLMPEGFRMKLLKGTLDQALKPELKEPQQAHT